MSDAGQPRKLTPKDVKYIRETIDHSNLEQLAEKYDCSTITIRNAILGKSVYGEVKKPTPLLKVPRQRHKRSNKTTKLTKAFIAKVKDMRQNLKSDSSLKKQHIEEMGLHWNTGANTICSKLFGISNSYVSRICNGHYDDRD